MILGRHSDIYKKQYEDDKNIPLIIDNYKNLTEVKKTFLQYLPEGVYYDRNYYHDRSKCHDHDLRNAWEWDNFSGQQLAFDIDPENVNCPIHGPLTKRMREGKGLSFCEKAFDISKENTIRLYENLKQEYDDVRIVFSGRGFHIHVFDENTLIFNKDKRKRIAYQYLQFGIDKWVTIGQMRLIRIPYSLNGISSRLVIPLKKSQIDDFNPEVDALPDFLLD
jgi:DNA primase catalytic subunit